MIQGVHDLAGIFAMLRKFGPQRFVARNSNTEIYSTTLDGTYYVTIDLDFSPYVSNRAVAVCISVALKPTADGQQAGVVFVQNPENGATYIESSRLRGYSFLANDRIGVAGIVPLNSGKKVRFYIVDADDGVSFSVKMSGYFESLF